MRPIVYSIAEYDGFARDLAQQADCDVGHVERERFPDGEHYLRIDDELNDRDAVLVGGTVDHDATLELYDLACAAVENGAATLTLIVPYFGYSTMERAVTRGEAVMAKNRARMLSSIPRAKLGNEIVLLDLHTEGIPHYFEGTIRPFHVYAKPVIEPLVRELGGEHFVLGSTDAGRAKWVESLANDLRVPAVFVYKRRLGPGSTSITGVNARLDGETVVIYDDMIRTGGSLMSAAKAYRDAGAGAIYAIATHGVLPDDAFDRLLASGLFRAIATTDSHSNVRRLAGTALIVRSVVPLFVPFVRKTR